MTVVGWRVVEGAAQLLEWNEREAVLGDLAETDGSAWRGVLDVAGLIARRQVLLWKSWRPWLAAFGWALPCSFLLMGFSLSVSGAFRQVLGSFFGEGVEGTRLTLLLCRTTLLLIWAWSGGFVVGTISRKTLWASAAACFAPCVYCLSRFGVPHESPGSLVLFVVPGLWGVWRGLRGQQIGFKTALSLAVTATVLAIPIWAGPWMFVLALIWPGWFLVARALQQPAKA